MSFGLSRPPVVVNKDFEESDNKSIFPENKQFKNCCRIKEIDIVAYVDDFGDILHVNSKKSFGAGFFICHTKNVDRFSSELQQIIPEKIHFRKMKTPEEQLNIAEKINKFLLSCNMSYCAGGAVMSNIETNKFIMEGDRNSKLSVLIAQFSKICSASLSLKYKKFDRINLSYIVEEVGNHKDFSKRVEKIKSHILEEIELFSKKAAEKWTKNSFPQVVVDFKYVESKNNTKISQLADAFAFMTRRYYCHQDDHTKEMYSILKTHFNLYKGAQDKRASDTGILDLNVNLDEIRRNVLKRSTSRTAQL